MKKIAILLVLALAGSAAAQGVESEVRPGPGAKDFAGAIGLFRCTATYFNTPITVAHTAQAVTNIRAVLKGEVVQLDYREFDASGFPTVEVLDHVFTGPLGGERQFTDSNRGRHRGTFEVSGDTIEFAGDYVISVLVPVPGIPVLVPVQFNFPFTETVRRTNDARGKTLSFTADSRLDFASVGDPRILTFQALACDRVGN